MKHYEPFEINNQIFQLSHLDAFYVEYIQAATKYKAKKRYRCLIEFGVHCFTRSPNTHKGETLESYESNLHYTTEKETRIFCIERYQFSLQLPKILREMDKQKCFFTSANDKFLTIYIQNQSGETVDYEIYFSLKKSKECDVHIFINSAYVRSGDYQTAPLRRKRISFFVLLNNTVMNKRIKKPV